MDGDAFVRFLEIDPVIFRPIAIQLFALALNHAKPLRIEMVQIFGQNLELCEQLKLQFLWQRRYLARTQLVEDDLEHGLLKVNASDAAANSGSDFPSNRPGALSQLRARNFLISIASHENNFVACLHIVDLAHVDHH